MLEIVSVRLRCVANIPAGRAWFNRQCLHTRTSGPDGLFCAQHAAQIDRRRNLEIPEDETRDDA